MLAQRKELNILIADDDDTTRHVLRLLLREHGHQVVAEAPDGEKAVELCVLHKPDIAFLDIDMPVMDGHSAAERIKQNMPGIGMIMVTNQPTLGNVQKALQIGISGFVVKPFNATKVVDAIDNCLKHKR